MTHFEALTLMAAHAFFPPAPRPAHPALDWAIFEVGLGGLHDATNALPHRFSVITRLGFDHAAELGPTLRDIARNKFGIVHPGCEVVHAPFEDAGVQELARQIQGATGTAWSVAPPAAVVDAGVPEREPRFLVDTAWGRAEVRLPGARGAENTALALATFRMLGFDPAPHLRALAQVRWPGRMERIELGSAPCPVWLSGDHNPQGVESLVELLARFQRSRLHLLVGIGREKDLGAMLGRLFEIPDAELHLTVPPWKGRPLETYDARWLAAAASTEPDPELALRAVLARAGREDLVVVTGSLYLVGAIRRLAVSPGSSRG